MKVSLILCTRNRAKDLQQTLEAFTRLTVPAGLSCEFVVVDNGSTDDTRDVIRAARTAPLPPRYVYEPARGVSHARNRAIDETTGDILLWTDDDVRPVPDWIEQMCAPMALHDTCAVAGNVTLAPHLLRPWMTLLHRSWLADTAWLDRENPRGFVGANMAFTRSVLKHVPRFDPELGPGALGFADEQLFARQLLEAGVKIHCQPDANVVHHFSPDRLKREAWLETAEKRGRTHAYVGHHWMHWGARMLRLRLLQAKLRLALWSLTHPAAANEDEGCSETELDLRYRCALLRGHLRESKRPRNYAYRGAVRHAHLGAASSTPGLRTDHTAPNGALHRP